MLSIPPTRRGKLSSERFRAIDEAASIEDWSLDAGVKVILTVGRRSTRGGGDSGDTSSQLASASSSFICSHIFNRHALVMIAQKRTGHR